MGRHCSTCFSEHKADIERRVREGRSFLDIARWLKEVGDPISNVAIAKHAKEHMGVTPKRGARPYSPDFLTAVVDDAAAQLAEGTIRASLRDGIAAQKALDERAARSDDKQLVLVLAQVLGGGYVPEAIEGAYVEVPALPPGSPKEIV